MMIYRKGLGLFLALSIALLTGCSTVADVALSKAAADPEVKVVLKEDIAAAIKIAESKNDVVAVNCFKAIQKNYVDVSPDLVVEPKGVFSAYEKARLAARGLDRKGVPEEVHVMCSPLIVDAANAAVKLRLLFGL